MRACPAHTVAIRFDRFGLHAAQLQALEQALIVARKWLWKFVCHKHSPRAKVQKIPCGAEEDYGFESNGANLSMLQYVAVVFSKAVHVIFFAVLLAIHAASAFA